MPAPSTPPLSNIVSLVGDDPGLPANIVAADIAGGQDAARLMNSVILTAIRATGANSDGRIDADDARAISDYIRSRPALYEDFVTGHGDDEGSEETGFHLVQGDGGAFLFQGRRFIDTVADAIYHIGFAYSGGVNGRFVNEDGDQNERVDDVAGWLNYFLNGTNVVYGTDGSETLHSGHYSFALTDAESELFLAGAGNDSVWMGDGDDTLRGEAGNDVSAGGAGDDRMWGGDGNDSLYGDDGDDVLGGGLGSDRIGGGAGNDRIYGSDGNDTLYGEEGGDTIFGGAGNDTLGGQEGDDRMGGGAGSDRVDGGDGQDTLWGGDDNDTVYAGAGDDTLGGGRGDDLVGGQDGDDLMRGGGGSDTLWGEGGDDTASGGLGDDRIGGGAGNDALFGDADDDTLGGDDGNDVLSGGSGDDSLWGANGDDRLIGGTGADTLSGYEEVEGADIFVFSPGDSGVTVGQFDTITHFTRGTDLIDLSAFGGLQFSASGLAGSVRGQVAFDGDFVLIDTDGSGAANETIEVKWTDTLSASDFIL